MVSTAILQRAQSQPPQKQVQAQHEAATWMLAATVQRSAREKKSFENTMRRLGHNISFIDKFWTTGVFHLLRTVWHTKVKTLLCFYTGIY